MLQSGTAVLVDRYGTPRVKCNCGNPLTKPVAQLSGGQRRRVAIVRAMMAHADLTVLDEPFKGLDEETKDRVMGHVRDRLAGRTALLITHDPAEAARFEGPHVSLGPPR